MLDAVATVAVAMVAGGSLEVAIRLGLGMLGLQFAIGSANDIADAPADAIAKAWKPIPSGSLTRRNALAVCLVASIAGLTFAASVSTEALWVAFAGLADGLLYDLKLKATPVAWLPFAVGVGLLPLYGWIGGRGAITPAFAGIVALSVVAGAVLALANAYGDLERDRLSGTRTIATLLGPRRTLILDAAGTAVLQIVVLAITIAVRGPVGLMVAEVSGCSLGWLGLAPTGFDDDRLKTLVWEVQAVGFAVLGTAWLAVLSTGGFLGS